jgi:drug/metabolite transporter (DMT)-like permease
MAMTAQVDRPAAPLSRRPALTAQDAGMLLVCLIWGLNFSLTKFALAEIPALPFTAIRFVLASVLLGLVLRVAEKPAAVDAAGLKRLIILGLVGNTVYQLAFTVGLSRTTATNSALILSTVPTVVALFAGALGLERITSRMWVGIALGTLGVILVIATRGVGFDMRTLPGDLLTLAAVLCWAAYTLGLRRVPDGITPLRVTALTTMAGTPILVLAGIPGMLRLDWGAVSISAWLSLGYAAVLSLVVAYVLWNRSVKAVGGTRTAIYMCITPLFAVLGAWLLLGEQPHPLQALGAICIVAGVLLTRADGRTGGETDRRTGGRTS